MTSSGLIENGKTDNTLIESRNDYILFVKLQIADMPISDKFKSLLREMCMNGFDDGFSMHRDGSLEYSRLKEFKERQ